MVVASASRLSRLSLSTQRFSSTLVSQPEVCRPIILRSECARLFHSNRQKWAGLLTVGQLASLVSSRATGAPAMRNFISRSRTLSSFTDTCEHVLESFWHRIHDIARLRSFTPRNPILSDMDKIFQARRKSPIDSDEADFSYPNISLIETRHFIPAALKASQEAREAYGRLENLMDEAMQTVEEKPNCEQRTIAGNRRLNDLLMLLWDMERIRLPLQYIERLSHLVVKVNCPRNASAAEKVLQAHCRAGEILQSVNVPRSSFQVVKSVVEGMQQIESGGVERMCKDSGALVPVNATMDEWERALFLFMKTNAPIASSAFADYKDEGGIGDIDEREFSMMEQRINAIQAELSRLISPLELHRSKRKYPDPARILLLSYEILNLKDKQSKALGFANYADMYLSLSMSAPTTTTITNLHEFVRSKALPLAMKQLGLEEKKDPPLDKISTSGAKKTVDPLQNKPVVWSRMTPYLELNSVLDGLFRLSRTLFGVVIEEVNHLGKASDVKIWHDDVRLFMVKDEESEEHLGSFYLDPFRRPETKVVGNPAFTVPLLDRTVAVERETGVGAGTVIAVTKPLVCIVCHVEPPLWDHSPCLLSFDEATDLFHEFGHALQHMLTTVSIPSVAGSNGIEGDAVEFPSQFLAQWLYNRKVLKGIAKHWKTREAAPEALLDELEEERLRRAPYRLLQQVYDGELELYLHGSWSREESLVDVQTRLCNRYTPYNMPEERGDLSALASVFVTANSADFTYRYIWSELSSTDAYEAFQEVGWEDEEGLRKLGRRFRDTVLALGGSAHPVDVFREFRGREVDKRAFLRWNGLT